jgi:hypothetical protein
MTESLSTLDDDAAARRPGFAKADALDLMSAAPFTHLRSLS